MNDAAPRLAMRAITKRFGATVALDDVDLTVGPGEVHALVGENGAGKSTLMKVLSGAIRPDSGAITLDGRPFVPGDPLAARRAGISMIYQELNLAPHLTVEENLTLGIEARRLGILRRGPHRQRIADVLRRLEHPHLRPHTRVMDLSPAGRQLVEIARALLTDARVLVMDEPTSSLGLADIERLFAVIDRLRDEGVSIVYISHFLEEVQRVADRYTVLRDGRVAASGDVAATTLEALVEQMIGRRLEEMFPRVPHDVGDAVLFIGGLTGRRLPVEVDLYVHRGEILGLAGLVGAGRTELLRGVFGLDPVRRGTVRMAGYRGENARRGSPARRLAQGIGLLSEDRATEGLALSRSVADNMTLSHLRPLATWGWVPLRRLERATAGWLGRLDVRSRGPRQPARDLSGGNQQKVALARLLLHDVDVLLLDEPTRGVDVGSKAQIYRLIGQLAAAGKAILIVSSTVPELLGICDRVAVMHRGRLVASRPAAQWTEREVIAVAVTGKESAA